MKRRNRQHYKYNKIKVQSKNLSKTQIKTDINEIYEIPEKIIFSPTTCASSEENKNAENDGNKLINGLLDKIFNDDFLILGIIAVLVIERLNLKKNGTDKSILNEYDLMIAALIYIYF